MTKPPKRPRLTLLESRSSRVQDALDTLVDARSQRAARLIRALETDDLRMLLFAAVTSVDERWRVRKPVPLPPSDEETEIARRKIAAWLTEHPEAIVPATLAISDAVAAHDPRRRDDDKAAA